MLSWLIEKIVPGPEETRLIVTQCPVDNNDDPQAAAACGEFVAHTPDSLDPRIFRRGVAITLAGMVDGVEEEGISPKKVPRPQVRVIEIHAWAERGEGLRRRGIRPEIPFPLTHRRSSHPEAGMGYIYAHRAWK